MGVYRCQPCVGLTCKRINHREDGDSIVLIMLVTQLLAKGTGK